MENTLGIPVTVEQVAQLAPHMQPGYREALRAGQPVLDQWGISASPLRVAHFLAQVLHESQALTVEYENLHYSAQRLAKVWPARFRPHGPLDPAVYARDPGKLADLVYGGRMGNRAPGDGYTFRGRGMLQLTGRGAYQRVTQLLREAGAAPPDFCAHPDAVLDPRWCLQVAAATWHDKGCNELADADDLAGLTERINGAGNGLAERGEWCRCASRIWCPA